MENLSAKERENYYIHIKNNSKNLVSTIDNLVDMAHLSTNQIKVNLEPIILSSFCNNLIKVTESKLKECDKNNIKIESNISIFHHQEILTDESLLTKITNHLIDNAIKFTDEGYISISCICNEKILEFSIKDSGVGIFDKNKELIFEQFRQGQEQLTREFEGSGLGLTITKNLVELLNGKIKVESSKGIGSEFIIEIPVTPIDQKEKKNLKSVEVHDKERAIR